MTHKEIKKQARTLVGNAAPELARTETQKDLDGQQIRSVFIGTVFFDYAIGQILPPFANSNVDVCPRCDGVGKSRTKFTECSLCFGTGERRLEDLKLARGRNLLTEKALSLPSLCASYGSLFVLRDSQMFECISCQGHGYTMDSCSHCQGMGSREVLEDEWMQEALEECAEIYGYCVEPGEGDPCDIFLNQIVEDCEEVANA